MIQNLQSKTVLGLLSLLIVASVAAILGKLTPELVDVIKWVGGSFMAVRVTANAMENLPSKKAE